MASVNFDVIGNPQPAAMMDVLNAIGRLTGTEPAYEALGLGAASFDLLYIVVTSAFFQLVWAASVLSADTKNAGDLWTNKMTLFESLNEVTRSRFHKLTQHLQAFRALGHEVAIAVPTHFQYLKRGAGILVAEDDAADIAWKMLHLSRCSEDVQAIIAKSRLDRPGRQVDEPSDTQTLPVSVEIHLSEIGDPVIMGVAIRR